MRGINRYDSFGECDQSKLSEDPNTETSEMGTDGQFAGEEETINVKRKKTQKTSPCDILLRRIYRDVQCQFYEQYKIPCRGHRTFTCIKGEDGI